jgi:hypothetical protein
MDSSLCILDKFTGSWVLLDQPFLDQPFLDQPFLDQPFLDQLRIEEAVLVLY